jgi:hypothetical protein
LLIDVLLVKFGRSPMNSYVNCPQVHSNLTQFEFLNLRWNSCSK